jgi:hypothetical protein
VGAIQLAKAAHGEFDRKILRRWLEAEITRADDRALVDLGPR